MADVVEVHAVDHVLALDHDLILDLIHVDAIHVLDQEVVLVLVDIDIIIAAVLVQDLPDIVDMIATEIITEVIAEVLCLLVADMLEIEIIHNQVDVLECLA